MKMSPLLLGSILISNVLFGQQDGSKTKDMIRSEINSSGINSKNFERIIAFTDESKQETKIKTEHFYKRWKKIEKKFYGTDFVIKQCISREKESNFFEVYNHNFKIIIATDNKNKITDVEIISMLLPKDFPQEN